MNTYGIDYSMTCPAVCSQKNGVYSAHFLTDTIRYCRTWTFDTRVGSLTITGTHPTPFVSQEERFYDISQWAVGLIGPGRVFIEDYAMGARGRVFHIAENTGLLKHYLWKTKKDFETVAPTALKKFAFGKGNADKDKMLEAFIAITGLDLRKEMMPNTSKSVSPVSDVVDAFFLARFGMV